MNTKLRVANKMSYESVKADFHREKFTFRFLELTDGAVARLRASLPDVDLRIHPRDTGNVVTFVIEDGLDRKALYSFLDSEPLDAKSYSIWVSVVSSSDHDGVYLPEHVLEIIRRTRGGVDFSFVGCLDDEPSSSEAIDSGTLPS
jgi:hypothetical protein